MSEKIEILEKKDGAFEGDDGEERSWWWYKAKRLSDGVSIRIGSGKDLEVGGGIQELELEKVEQVFFRKDGKKKIGYWYRHIV